MDWTTVVSSLFVLVGAAMLMPPAERSPDGVLFSRIQPPRRERSSL